MQRTVSRKTRRVGKVYRKKVARSKLRKVSRKRMKKNRRRLKR
jgi:hypothetical protein